MAVDLTAILDSVERALPPIKDVRLRYDGLQYGRDRWQVTVVYRGLPMASSDPIDPLDLWDGNPDEWGAKLRDDELVRRIWCAAKQAVSRFNGGRGLTSWPLRGLPILRTIVEYESAQQAGEQS